ncbi:MAG: hypothetical protein PHE29_14195, partial [Tissierellia bacterium]|nr:hypothetical protein [Tissierellia bacterium]
YESKSANGYLWYKIADGQWVAADPSWLTLYPKKVEEPPHEELPPIDDNSEDNHSGDDTGGGNVPSIDNEPRSPVKIKISDIIIKFIEKLIKIFFKGGK